tara:strand:- start:718 stop:849 length:132 start_codon:yes stop_codon:yes gene_type:complete
VEDYKVYTVFVSFEAKDEEDAENFVLDMQPSDWLDHLQVDEEE